MKFNKILKFFLYFLSVFIIIMLMFFIYYGGFKSIETREQIEGGEILVYSDFSGDYSEGAKAMDSIYVSLVKNENIWAEKGFATYYDDPATSEKDILKAEVGCILQDADSTTIERLKLKYKVKVAPKQKYLTAVFPYKSMLSIFFGMTKVYPAMEKHIEQNRLAPNGYMMEIYDRQKKQISYRKEIETPS